MSEQKSKRGPAKGQGGRPPTGAVRIVLKVQPEVDEIIRAESAAAGVPMGEWVGRAILERTAPISRLS